MSAQQRLRATNGKAEECPYSEVLYNAIDALGRLAVLEAENARLRAVLETPDLVRWLDRYGDGPPALMGDEDEVIWRLAGFLNSARDALTSGLPAAVPESPSTP